jgi:hypothetical protein
MLLTNPSSQKEARALLQCNALADIEFEKYATIV